jgi:hypothetical protein
MQKPKILNLFLINISMLFSILNMHTNCLKNSKFSLEKKEILTPNNLEEIYQTNVQKEVVSEIISK